MTFLKICLYTRDKPSLEPKEIDHSLSQTDGAGICGTIAVSVDDKTGYLFFSSPLVGCRKMCFGLDREKLIDDADHGNPFELELNGVKISSKGVSTGVDNHWVGCTIEFS